MKLRPPVDHDRLAVYVENMKRVYQGAIDKAGTNVSARSLNKIKNHLQCLAMIQKIVSEHHEMANGHGYDAGTTHFNLATMATLIKPNGEIILIPRRP